MTELIKEHWLLSLFGTLLLGALGSGLWETALKPLFSKTGKVLFLIFSLGMKTASNNIYKEAAKGHTEKSSLFLTQQFIAIASAFLIVAIFIVYTKYSMLVLGGSSFLECNKIESFAEKAECGIEMSKELLSWMVPAFMFITALMIGVLFYTYLKLIYVNSIVTNFYQYLRICKPYITPEDVTKIEQSFSLMENKDDYKKIINEFKSVADKQDITLPRLENNI